MNYETRFDVVNTPTVTRSLYRHWRKCGMPRYETNMMVIGLATVFPQFGEVIQTVSRQGD